MAVHRYGRVQRWISAHPMTVEVGMLHDPEDVQNIDPREGRYANYFQVGHNAVEFLLDFGQSYAAHGPGQLHTRIITSPVYAKAFAALLQQALAQYEQTFGPLPEANETEGV